MLDDGLLDRHPLALCSTGGTATETETGDENADADGAARWPPVECPRDFVTWRLAGRQRHKEGRPETTSYKNESDFKGPV